MTYDEFKLLGIKKARYWLKNRVDSDKVLDFGVINSVLTNIDSSKFPTFKEKEIAFGITAATLAWEFLAHITINEIKTMDGEISEGGLIVFRNFEKPYTQDYTMFHLLNVGLIELEWEVVEYNKESSEWGAKTDIDEDCDFPETKTQSFENVVNEALKIINKEET